MIKDEVCHDIDDGCLWRYIFWLSFFRGSLDVLELFLSLWLFSIIGDISEELNCSGFLRGLFLWPIIISGSYHLINIEQYISITFLNIKSSGNYDRLLGSMPDFVFDQCFPFGHFVQIEVEFTNGFNYLLLLFMAFFRLWAIWILIIFFFFFFFLFVWFLWNILFLFQTEKFRMI